MGIWRKNPDRALERRLRDERPRAREEFVRLLSGAPESSSQGKASPGRRGVPRLAILAAATALVAGSLGAAGALGSASASLHTFGDNVIHIVSPSSYGSQGNNYGGSDNGKDPFDYEYHHQVPICENGQIVYIPIGEYFWLVLHGEKPSTDCFRNLLVLVKGAGHGNVSSSPSGINCPFDCFAVYLTNTVVTLTETPANGSSFAGWGGFCFGTATTCTVTMSQSRFVTASFTRTS